MNAKYRDMIKSNKITGRITMKKLLLIALALVMAAAVPVMAANTVTTGAGTIKIVPDGSTDWLWSESGQLPINGIVIYSIQFVPSDTSDVLILHDTGIDGVEVFNSGPTDSTAPVIKYFPNGKRVKLVFDASDCTFTTAASAAIYIEYQP